MKLTNCAIAADGGSIGLSFITAEKQTIHVMLDKGIDSPTKNKLFATHCGEQALTLDQERALLFALKCAEVVDNECKELLDQVINVLELR